MNIKFSDIVSQFTVLEDAWRSYPPVSNASKLADRFAKTVSPGGDLPWLMGGGVEQSRLEWGMAFREEWGPSC